jgi:hypothetical protein
LRERRNKDLPTDANGTYDTDSFLIGIDSHASRCISNRINHFITALTPTKAQVQGIGNELLQVKGEGMLEWPIEDDLGRTHKIQIKNALYVPRSPICLLLPQHWGQQANDEFPNKRGTWVGDYPDCCILYWNQSKFQQTVKYDPCLNVA